MYVSSLTIISITCVLFAGIHLFFESSHFFRGHFPGNPIMPGVIIIEALAQASGIIDGNIQLEDDSITTFENQQVRFLF